MMLIVHLHGALARKGAPWGGLPVPTSARAPLGSVGLRALKIRDLTAMAVVVFGTSVGDAAFAVRDGLWGCARPPARP